MEEANVPRYEQTIDVPARVFSERLDELTQAGRSASGSVYSRLALIHQVAKALAMEAVST